MENRVDRETGIIKGVSLIAFGAAKGHKILCDDETLKQVLEKGKAFKNGIPIKWNPDTNDHGPASICGKPIQNTYRISGGKVLCDVQVYKSYPYKDYLFDICEDRPDNFGISIEFKGDPETKDGINFARCEELNAATFVDMPAANSEGLFQEKEKPTEETNMALSAEDKREFASMLSEAIKPLSEKVDKTQKDFQAFQEGAKKETPPTADEMKEAGCADTDSDDDKAKKVTAYRQKMNAPVTNAGLMKFFRANGGRPVGASVPADGDKGGDAFMAKVNHFKTGEVTEPEAIRLAAKAFPKLYNAFMAKPAKQPEAA
jgi:flagellar hook-basal body complex protein FliE